MRTLTIAMILALAASVSQAAKPAAKPVAKRQGPKESMGREFNFGGSTLQGKYQTPGEGVATVENEKILEDLLGMRRDFKDRMERSSAGH